MKPAPIDYLGSVLFIVKTYLRAESMARGLGLTLDQWKQSVESTSVLLKSGFTPDEITDAARMYQRGKRTL